MRRIAAPILLLILLSVVPAGAACTGDCDNGGSVSIDELVQGVGMALGTEDLSRCPAFDANASGDVSIDEIIAAVGAALEGCPAVTPGVDTPTESPTAAPPTATPPAHDTETPTATPTTGPFMHFCDLPGSLQFDEHGSVLVPGGPNDAPDLSFVHLPAGFCVHYYGNVGNVRQLRFAPGGDLFAASPSTLTTGGRGDMGLNAVAVLPDDNLDGFADSVVPFLQNLPSTQGLLFANGFFYYQNGTKILRLPFNAGQRVASGEPEQVVEIGRNTGRFDDRLHWTKVMDIADDGTIYVTNGGSQSEICDPLHPFRGGIFAIDGTTGGKPIAKGFRNPISVRCARGFNRCFAIELARDYTQAIGGREKLVTVREGDDWGHPCCATANQPYPDLTPVPDCSEVDHEDGAFIVGHTPFDLDFETGKWPPPWNNRVYIPMHGVFGTWEGARIVSFAMDPITGEVIMGSELPSQDPGSFLDFATGWDDDTRTHGRPANIAFAPDGRLFMGNDNTGDIIWIAPMGL